GQRCALRCNALSLEWTERALILAWLLRQWRLARQIDSSPSIRAPRRSRGRIWGATMLIFSSFIVRPPPPLRTSKGPTSTCTAAWALALALGADAGVPAGLALRAALAAAAPCCASSIHSMALGTGSRPDHGV